MGAVDSAIILHTVCHTQNVFVLHSIVQLLPHELDRRWFVAMVSCKFVQRLLRLNMQWQGFLHVRASGERRRELSRNTWQSKKARHTTRGLRCDTLSPHSLQTPSTCARLSAKLAWMLPAPTLIAAAPPAVWARRRLETKSVASFNSSGW